ncbi:hypothetical protein EDB89DRAFT_1978153 [Lactarius sanguifluus]|nr:hypothetical protein EDB89DRAFT_1978153 [Lactarius sanguifluus]
MRVVAILGSNSFWLCVSIVTSFSSPPLHTQTPLLATSESMFTPTQVSTAELLVVVRADYLPRTSYRCCLTARSEICYHDICRRGCRQFKPPSGSGKPLTFPSLPALERTNVALLELSRLSGAQLRVFYRSGDDRGIFRPPPRRSVQLCGAINTSWSREYPQFGCDLFDIVRTRTKK